MINITKKEKSINNPKVSADSFYFKLPALYKGKKDLTCYLLQILFFLSETISFFILLYDKRNLLVTLELQ